MGGGFAVGTGNGIAQRQQHFGDAAHADAANAHQMNALKIAEADHHGATFSVRRGNGTSRKRVELLASA